MDQTWNSARWEARPEDPGFGSTAMLLKYALPLVLSNTGVVLQQFVDRMFLAWHAPESVAGAGMAGMISACFIALFATTTGFTSIFAAQYLGAKRPSRLGPVVYQGLYLSLAFGIVTALLAHAAGPIFAAIGHSPAVRLAEIDYFTVTMRGGATFMATAAVFGFFVGKGETRKVMALQIGAIVANVVLDYGLVFGNLGLPAWGAAGAAWATVIAQALMLAAALALFTGRRYREKYATASAWRPELPLARRILRYGLPSGFRAVVELVLWSLFLAMIGRLGDTELAVTNVAFGINNLAWQPMIGVSMAVAMLVGKAQGAGRPDQSRRVMIRGLALAQIWEMIGAVVFLFFPHFLLGFFFRDLPPGEADTYYRMGTHLLRFVAAYCLIDSVNLVFSQGLIGAGDSWWTSKMTLAITLVALAGLFLLGRAGAGLYSYWLAITVYVAVCAAAWVWRYRGAAWEKMQVVETVVVDDSNA